MPDDAGVRITHLDPLVRMDDRRMPDIPAKDFPTHWLPTLLRRSLGHDRSRACPLRLKPRRNLTVLTLLTRLIPHWNMLYLDIWQP